jgi:hypothetical protein
MKAVKVRLLVALVLLVGWLCWLGYLAATQTNPVVLSRSQIMASTHFILADVTMDSATGQPSKSVTVKEDLRPLGTPLSGTILVHNIKEARVAGESDATRFSQGPYLLMLTKLPDGEGFELTPAPRAPGDEHPFRPRPWAYRWSAPGVQEQFGSLVPKK